MSRNETNGQHESNVIYGIHVRYHRNDARWFAIISLATMLISYIGMANSSISYFGFSSDIGSYLSLYPFIVSESMIMIPFHFLIAMMFFAGVEWYVLCRHCPCYEYSGKEHRNEDKFYCLANWGSPKLFKYKSSSVSTTGRVVFLAWGIGFSFLFQTLYLWDRLDWLVAYLFIVFMFLATLRHWACSSCPNFGCVLNCVPEDDRKRFIEEMKSGKIYG